MPWETVSTDSEITAIHAALLPTEPDGVVLYFGDWAAMGGGAQVQDVTYSRLYRMAPGLADPIETLVDEAVPDTDAFCCGQAFLADGRLLAAGGTQGWAQQHHEHPDHYDGERACWIYLPRAGRWTKAEDLHFQPGDEPVGGGRWYPTLVTLANGEVIAIGGHPAIDDDYLNRHNNHLAERYAPGSDRWTLLTAEPTAPPSVETDSYPRFHLMPDGRLFSDTVGNGGARRLFDPFSGVWTGPDVDGVDTLPGFYNRGSAATSVLLPLLPPSYRPRVLATNSADATAFRIDVDDSPEWVDTAARMGAAAGRRRNNACATLLPTGQVVVTGGWHNADGGDAGADDVSLATREPELYTPGIDWAAGDFSVSNDEAWETLEDPAPTRRGYHSVALLLPDGRVWHGGSTTSGDGANRDIELFSPPYIDVAGRPTISDCPENVGYMMDFLVGTPQANAIARVALIRCGSITHGFNSDQRYVGLNFAVENGNTLRVNAPPNGRVAPPGAYMLFLIDDQDRVCERASFIRVSRQKLVVSADISTFSIHEVEALGTPAQFNDALFVVFDGFLPHEVSTPTATLRRLNGTGVPGMEATFGPPAFEAGSQAEDVAQRVVYPVRIRFTSTAAFDAIPDADDFQTITFRAEAGLFSAQVNLQLSKNPNPRMRDGDPHYLSVDLRVFKANPGQEPVTAGIPHPPAGDSGAYDYIQDVLTAYNDAAGDTDHPFDALPTDLAVNRLELGTNDAGGDPVFNYAIARVRFRAPEGIDALDVRVFFRMWTTGWTALEFFTNGSYRRAGDGPGAAPLLGLRGGEINTVPCFAEPRVADMTAQADPTNRRTLQGANAAEVHGYFGCWLDVNQDVPRFPLAPASDGPFSDDDDPDGLRSIQELMRGLHQCLVAEIHYQPDPVISGATPGSSDNLAQRNILFDFSDNPGSFAAHLVHHTFEVEPSPVSFGQSVLAGDGAVGTTRLHPDELVIDWGDLPRDSLVTFYMPQLDAHEVVRAAAARQAPGNLRAAAPDTIRCKVTEVGFMPIPGPLEQPIAGLMSVQLPPGVPYGRTYRVVLRQVAGRGYRVLGTTEFRIEVKQASELLDSFVHNLAVLKHVARSIPDANRWHPVFRRYLAELGERIRAFGGDPEAVSPNPNGTGGSVGSGPPDAGSNEDDHGAVLCVKGNVATLHYDCHGAFEGFTLQDCDEEWRFDCIEPGLERVVLTACREGLRATVHARYGWPTDAALNRSCPWSGRPVHIDALTRYRDRLVGFCSAAHRDDFARAIAMAEQSGEGDALNDRCPFSGKPVDPRAVADHRGQRVGFCSIAHRDRFAKACRIFEQALACSEPCDDVRLTVERMVLHC